MAGRVTISELRDRIADLEVENEELSQTLDDVYSIVAPQAEEEETEPPDDEE